MGGTGIKKKRKKEKDMEKGRHVTLVLSFGKGRNHP